MRLVQTHDAARCSRPSGPSKIGVGVDVGASAEIEGAAGRSPIPFGAALVLEPIDAQWRVDGDVIYAADLGAHNEVLRRRDSGMVKAERPGSTNRFGAFTGVPATAYSPALSRAEYHRRCRA